MSEIGFKLHRSIPQDRVQKQGGSFNLEESVEQVWRQFAVGLKRFIAKSVADPYDAEDILQEVFFKIHRHLAKLKDRRKISSWIYQITRNTITDHYRKSKRLPAAGFREAETARPRPAQVSFNREITACLKPMIRHLPAHYREALILSDLEGMTQQQTAEALGLSLSGAKSRVQRARERLKIMLLDCCHFQLDRWGNVLEYTPKQHACHYCSAGSGRG